MSNDTIIGIVYESIRDMHRSRKNMKHNAWIFGLGSRDGKSFFSFYDLHVLPVMLSTYPTSDLFDSLSISIDGNNEVYISE